MADLFADVKVGDVFFEVHNYGLNRYVVFRVTDSQFSDGFWSYRKSDGKQIGSKWDYVKPESAELLEKWERQRTVKAAMGLCNKAIETLAKARGDEAIRLAALLPPELKGE